MVLWFNDLLRDILINKFNSTMDKDIGCIFIDLLE